MSPQLGPALGSPGHCLASSPELHMSLLAVLMALGTFSLLLNPGATFCRMPLPSLPKPAWCPFLSAPVLLGPLILWGPRAAQSPADDTGKPCVRHLTAAGFCISLNHCSFSFLKRGLVIPTLDQYCEAESMYHYSHAEIMRSGQLLLCAFNPNTVRGQGKRTVSLSPTWGNLMTQ